jgi:hypothetical protein
MNDEQMQRIIAFQKATENVTETKDILATLDAFTSPPPVNVRAEQVQRVRVALTNLQASAWSKLDLAESASLSYEIGELINLERALRDNS